MFSQFQIKSIFKALRTSADISKCWTETQPEISSCKQCRCWSTLTRKNSLERPKPRKKPRGSRLWGVASPLLAVPGGDYNRTWPRCSNVHKWPAWSNNNNHRQNSWTWSSSTARWTGDSKESSCQVVLRQFNTVELNPIQFSLITLSENNTFLEENPCCQSRSV